MTLHPTNVLTPGLARGDGYAAKRATNGAVKLLQEYLTLAGQALTLDGEFGPATEAALDAVCSVRVLDPLAVDLLGRLVFGERLGWIGDLATIALVHVGCRELKGNTGPWVRQFADGKEGDPWCGYAARYWARQARHPWAERISPSCDLTARNAVKDGRLRPPGERPARGDLYLRRNRYNPDDFEHVGVVLSCADGQIGTVSGNSNGSGGREGNEVVVGRSGITDRLAFVRMS